MTQRKGALSRVDVGGSDSFNRWWDRYGWRAAGVYIVKFIARRAWTAGYRAGRREL